MKKLLGIVGTITITGSGMSGIFGNAPAPTKNEINYLQTSNNNLEKLKRNKRNIYNLDIPAIQQQSDYWCGPAIGESVLRYFGFQFNESPNVTLTSPAAQSTLSTHMNTQTISGQIFGTSPKNWANTINSYIKKHNLNNRRLYNTITPLLSFGMGTSSIFNDVVLNSLKNNTPVAFLYHGTTTSFGEQNHSHYILITEIVSTNPYMPNNKTYRYLNPWTGEFNTFSTIDLTTFLRNGGTLISYSEPRIYEDYEPMDTGKGLGTVSGNRFTNWRGISVNDQLGKPYMPKFEDQISRNHFSNQDLRNVIEKIQLGLIDNNDDISILNKVRMWNDTLDVSKVTVGDRGDGWARIDAKNNQDKYILGTSQIVNFKVNRKDLVNEIRKEKLGCLANDNNDTILNAISRNNPNLDMSKISIGDKGDGWARIDAKNNQDKYIPRTWKVVTWYWGLDLYNEIKNQVLGTLINDNNDTILNAISRNNPNLDMSKISIGDKGDGWARIDAKDHQNKYIPRTWKVVTWHILKPDPAKTTVHGGSLWWQFGW